MDIFSFVKIIRGLVELILLAEPFLFFNHIDFLLFLGFMVFLLAMFTRRSWVFRICNYGVLHKNR